MTPLRLTKLSGLAVLLAPLLSQCGPTQESGPTRQSGKIVAEMNSSDCFVDGAWTMSDGHGYSVACEWGGNTPSTPAGCSCTQDNVVVKSGVEPSCVCCTGGYLSPSDQDKCGSCVATACGFPY